MHYLRGKADWMVRGLPCEPAPSMRERLRALPYFITNLAPIVRTSWIAISRRSTVVQRAKDDVARLRAADPMPASSRNDVVAVVLNSEGALLGRLNLMEKALTRLTG
jgi:hypothetical protein